jgi:hypothetical protein
MKSLPIQFGFELIGSIKELRGKDGTILKTLHLTLAEICGGGNPL